MSQESGTQVSRPKPIHRKSIAFNFKDFSTAIAKGSIDVFLGNWSGAAEDGLDALGALGLKATTQEVAWLLVYSAIMQAMATLAKESLRITHDYNLNELKTIVNDALEESVLTINEGFFAHPENAEIIETVRQSFAVWVESVNVIKAEATTISHRLPIYFAFALHEEWGRRPSLYAPLKADLDTPFTQANDRGKAWLRYLSWLQKQVEEPVFLEAFSLKQVFVELRAYYERTVDEEIPDELRGHKFRKTEKIVVDLEKELEHWLAQTDKDDAIRLISGGPGSGKSSFAKMFAARQAKQGSIPVLFVPLHQFDPSDDLIESVERFVQMEGYLRHNPLDPEYREKRLLIIFDGLDELSMQGKIAERTAQDFVREVQRKVLQFNRQHASVQVLISGRHLAIQSNETAFRKEGQIFHVLPYFLSTDEQEAYVDDGKLLETDQRQEWWKRYGAASGKGYTKLPNELAQDNLLEITSQPLLNYLVALSYDRGELDFSAETNLNAIYNDLLKAVYERGWTGYQHVALQGIDERHFVRILEEIALAAWHGDGRTTTVKEIRQHCESSGLESLLERFQRSMQEDTRASITRLLTAFYFRQSSGYRESEETFEFTHKSFGEYLTARRIFRELKRVHDELQARSDDPDRGWSERTALVHWLRLSGPSPISRELFNFVRDEIRLHHHSKPNDISTWQKTLCHLIGFVLKHGSPMEQLAPRPDFLEEKRQARNAEEALLAVLSICAAFNERISEIAWPDKHSFSAWLSFLQPVPIEGRNELALSCLSYLKLDGCYLYVKDLFNAALAKSQLISSQLQYANLQSANLTGANLERASLERANLNYAHLTGAHLEGASLERAHLEGAHLEGANLTGANLTGANLERASLTGANLASANLTGANLASANLERANLERANITGAHITGAHLERASLERAWVLNSAGNYAEDASAHLAGVIFVDDHDESV